LVSLGERKGDHSDHRGEKKKKKKGKVFQPKPQPIQKFAQKLEKRGGRFRGKRINVGK